MIMKQNHILKKAVAAGLAAMMLASSAQAVLQRVGPVNPANGFPAWYEDRNGLALELCDVKSDAVLAGGWCLLLPGDVPGPAPEAFPANWAVEHFWWAGNARFNSMGFDAKTGTTVPVANNVNLILGLESTFTAEVPRNPDQISFGRWRALLISPPCNGSYTFYTPYKEPQTFQGVAGQRIFETDDFGIGAPGDFTGALGSSIGPFLRPSDASGGAPAPFVTGPDAKRYISNNADQVRTTGSPIPNRLASTNVANPQVNAFGVPASVKAQQFTNYVAVIGPGLVTGDCAANGGQEAVVTETMALMGRVVDGPLPSRTVVERATYRLVAPDTTPSFRIGGWAHGFQEAGRPVPALGMNLFQGDPANPANFRGEIGMDRFAIGDQVTVQPDPNQVVPTPRSNFFGGQTQPVNVVGGVTQTSPAVDHARIRTLTDAPPSVQDVKLVDDVAITAVDYNATLKTLTVKATSGGYLRANTTAGACAVPCLTLDSLGLPTINPVTKVLLPASTFEMKTPTGWTSKAASFEVVIANVAVPPNVVKVSSSLGGSDSRPVRYAGASVSTVVLQDDVVSTAMNLPLLGINVLENDVGYAPTGALTLCTAATGGTCATTATITGSGTFTVGANRTVNFTPVLNKLGPVSAWYQVGTLPAGVARGKLTVNIGNGVSQAIDDTGLNAVINRTLSTNVLRNDIIPNGIRPGSAVVVSGPFLQAGANLEPAPAGTAAAFSPLTGQLEFFTPTAGNYTLNYQWTDNNGQLAAPGTVVIAVQGNETLTVGNARYRTGTRALTASGTSSIRAAQVITVSNATGVADACAPGANNQPVAATLPRFGTTPPVNGVGGWDMGTVILPVGAPTPLALVAWSPFGGCVQFAPAVTR